MFLLLDNYDSFTYNLLHYLGELKVDIATIGELAANIPEDLMRQDGVETAIVQIEGFLRFLLDFPSGEEETAREGDGESRHDAGETVLAQAAPGEKEDD